MLFREREQIGKNLQARSINSEIGLLTVAQTIVLVPIDFDTFVKMFENRLHELKKQYKTIKV